mmetsp:Transcript_3992/g.8623  ORF Transcript_3992/g.8623 Transcript_3992/m.8623 type:complete len:201 (+) Transcript_3992:2650-3252(+)
MPQHCLNSSRGCGVGGLACMADAANLPCIMGVVKYSKSFAYLDSLVHCTGSCEHELVRRLGRARHIFKQLMPRVFSRRGVHETTRIRLYKTLVVPTLLYGAAESWALTASQMRRLDVFHTTCLRRLLHISRLDHVSNEVLYRRAHTKALSELLREHRLRWLGHVARRSDSRFIKQLLFAHSLEGKRRRGGVSYLERSCTC